MHVKILRFFAYFSLGAARPREKSVIWSLDLPQSTLADVMELKISLVLEFRRGDYAKKAPWQQMPLYPHNRKGRRIFFGIVCWFFLYLCWMAVEFPLELSSVDFEWIWIEKSVKIWPRTPLDLIHFPWHNCRGGAKPKVRGKATPDSCKICDILIFSGLFNWPRNHDETEVEITMKSRI